MPSNTSLGTSARPTTRRQPENDGRELVQAAAALLSGLVAERALSDETADLLWLDIAACAAARRFTSRARRRSLGPISDLTPGRPAQRRLHDEQHGAESDDARSSSTAGRRGRRPETLREEGIV